jgi:NhaP-type Na+/H+ and K+/H+ antiporter
MVTVGKKVDFMQIHGIVYVQVPRKDCFPMFRNLSRIALMFGIALFLVLGLPILATSSQMILFTISAVCIGIGAALFALVAASSKGTYTDAQSH